MRIDKKKKLKLLAGIHDQIDHVEEKKRLSRRNVFLGIAASVALLIGTFVFINQDSGRYSAPYGEMKTVNLPDGSSVILNANSSITYEPKWTRDMDREVWLDGEAYFDVADQPKKGSPNFIVHTNYGDVNVLGTEFNVKEREKIFEVVLTEGAVSLSLNTPSERSSQAITMIPGDKVSLDVKTKEVKKEQTNTELHTAWRFNKLICDNTSIAYLASIIEDHYGYQVDITDRALLERKLTGTLENPSLEDLMSAIAVAFDIQVEQTTPQTIRISNK